MTARSAFTLVELVVALALAGVVLGAFALVVVRQQRAYGDLTQRVRADAQMREGLAALAGDLAALSPSAGDVPIGGATDSSLEFRATVGTAVVCELLRGEIFLRLPSFVAPPQPGDTAWTYPDSGTRPLRWTPMTVSGVSTPVELPARCTTPADGRGPGPALALATTDAGVAAVAPGAPLRVTRRVRYSLYRAPDRRWYLGRREWSPAIGRFETIQPVSGPYAPYSPPGEPSGLRLRYFDRNGAELPAGSLSGLAAITVTLRRPPFADRHTLAAERSFTMALRASR